MTDDALRRRLAEILVEFAEAAHEAEEGIRVHPPAGEVDRAVQAILEAAGIRTSQPR